MTRKKIDIKRHKNTLTALLIDIVKALDGKIAFKGGTAAMMFYNLPRLSLDLDFDVLSTLSEEDKARLQGVIEKHGEIKEFQNKRFTIFYLIDYEKDAPNIKIELNTRVWQNNSYKIIWLFGIPIKMVDEATMLTNKLVALTDRKSPVVRDVFDVYYFLKTEWPIKEALIKERTGLVTADYLARAINLVEKKFSEKNILAGIGELLDEKQKAWAKENLKDEVIFHLKLKKENLKE